MSEDLVYLQCVKEGSKLRVKIISPGYYHDSNCSFPRDIRIAGRKYSVPRHAISFSEGPGYKFFYRINKNYIKIEENVPNLSPNISKVFEDESSDCIICMSSSKSVVFGNCGHYCSCEDCANKIKNSTGKCPVCRSKILVIVKRDQIGI